MIKAVYAIIFIGAVNFFSFLFWGGSALNGKEDNGKFFIVSHGLFKEVNEKMFNMIYIHELTVPFTHVMFLIGILILGYKKETSVSGFYV